MTSNLCACKEDFLEEVVFELGTEGPGSSSENQAKGREIQ